MQDERSIPRDLGDEARRWLVAHGEAPDLSATWEAADTPDTRSAHRRILEILFSPTADDLAV